jgi:hypothetical protein
MQLEDDAKFHTSAELSYNLMINNGDKRRNNAEFAEAQYLLATIAFDSCDFTRALGLFEGSVASRLGCGDGTTMEESRDAPLGVTMCHAALKDFRASKLSVKAMVPPAHTLLAKRPKLDDTKAQIEHAIGLVFH